MHHHRINFDKYHPGYFGKVGWEGLRTASCFFRHKFLSTLAFFHALVVSSYAK